MIRKLQIKFVAMCMILVTAVLGVVFTAVFFSAKQNIEVISHQVLQRVMEDDTPSGRPDLGAQPGRGRRSAALFHGESLGPQRNLRGLCHRRDLFQSAGHTGAADHSYRLSPAEPARGHYPQLRPAVSAPGLWTIRAHRLCGHVHGAGHIAGDHGLPICKSVWRRCCCFWASPSCWPGGPPARWQRPGSSSGSSFPTPLTS